MGERVGRVSFSGAVVVAGAVGVGSSVDGVVVSGDWGRGCGIGGVSGPRIGAKVGSGSPAALASAIAFSWASMRWKRVSACIWICSSISGGRS